MLFDDFLGEVDKGRSGENISLSTGLPKLDELIGGVGKATYYLIGANLGIGKTALADHSFVLMPYDQMLNNPEGNKIRIYYYSFEISRLKKIAKWVCHLIFRKYGIIIDIKEVYSRRSILSDEKYRMIKEFRDYIDKMEEYVHIFDIPINPTGLYMDVKKYMEANGKVIDVPKMIKGVEITFHKYVSNDPKEIFLYIEDHVGLARGEKDARTKKERIDKGSEYAVQLRNFYGASKLAISQFNREIADLDRRRFAELTPQLEDFKDSGNSQEDADVVMSLFNPLRYNMTEYNGMNVIGFGGRYRNMVVLKNRDGQDMKKHHLNMLGETGFFREFPDPFMNHHIREGKDFTKFT